MGQCLSTNVTNLVTENFYDDFLEAHNSYRSRHGVQPLTLDRKLSKYAQKRADKTAKKDLLKHLNNCKFGEALYRTPPNSKYKIPGEEAVDSWYEEIADYEFGKEPPDDDTFNDLGHFTQVVWADTKKVGVGVAKSASGRIYVLAIYDPCGNIDGQFPKMVPPPI